tara:strand:- start:349 stop:528 length:180 start_codon:yes stop_codon:yes gene_type:complete
MVKSKKRKMEEGLFKIIKQWEKEEPENFEMNNRVMDREELPMSLLTFLLRTNKVKGVEI